MGQGPRSGKRRIRCPGEQPGVGPLSAEIVGSCSANTLEEILAICRRFQEAGARAIELNMVCPSTGPHLGPEYARLGKWWADDTERAVAMIRAVKAAVRIPVWAKLPLARLVEQQFLAAIADSADLLGGYHQRLRCP